MILVQMHNIFRLLIGVPDYSIVVSRMEETKHVENDGYLIKHFFFRRILFEETSERT